MDFVNYSFQVLDGAGFSVFNGYFVVDTSVFPNLISAFYDYSSGADVLLPPTDVASYSEADNIFPLTEAGVNFYSTALQSFFDISQNHFNLYFDTNKNFYLYTTATHSFFYPPYLYSIIISPLSRFPCFKVDTKILTDK
jgi:hypothetical protein